MKDCFNSPACGHRSRISVPPLWYAKNVHTSSPLISLLRISFLSLRKLGSVGMLKVHAAVEVRS